MLGISCPINISKIVFSLFSFLFSLLPFLLIPSLSCFLSSFAFHFPPPSFYLFLNSKPNPNPSSLTFRFPATIDLLVALPFISFRFVSFVSRFCYSLTYLLPCLFSSILPFPPFIHSICSFDQPYLFFLRFWCGVSD